MKKIEIIFILFVSLCLAFLVCKSDEESEDVTTRTYIATQNPGDLWEWNINSDNTFNAENKTLSYTYSGTYITLPHGFLKLTVTVTDDPSVTPPAEAYALEYPNTVLLIKPAGSDSDMIVGVKEGSCFTTNGTFYWVNMLDDAFVDTADRAYGIAELTITGSDYSFDNSRYLLSGTLESSEVTGGFTCSAGIISHTTNPTIITITSSGLFIADGGPGGGGFIGMEAPASNIDINDLLAAGTEFRGIRFLDGSADPDNDDTEAVWARPSGAANELLAGGYDDPFEDGVVAASNVIITLGDQNSPGIINATLQDDPLDPARPIVFVVNIINGRYIIYGAHKTADPTGGGNFVVIEQ